MNKKENIALNPSGQKGEKIMKPPLFKLFMNNNNRKLHLFSNNISNSKDSAKNNSKPDNNDQNKNQEKNTQLNLQLFSYKILEAKHNSTPELYFKKKLNILIKKKRSHLLADFNEKALCDLQFRDYLKRYYTYKETEERIPKYVGYYKNYLTFFCRPFFTGYIINKKMVKHMEKVAQIFYNENYADEKDEEEEEKPKKNEKNIVIFNKKILKEIDDVDIYTVVTSEAAMKQIQKMNSLVNKNNQQNSKINNELNLFDSNTAQNNNIEQIKIDELSIYDNNYKLTPIKNTKCQRENILNSKSSREYANKLDGKFEINTKEIISGLKSQDLIPSTTNSINLLVEEMESKRKENSSKKIEEEKEKDDITNIHNNCIVIRGGKTTNHINININHLTIGQKILPPKEEQSNKKDKDDKNVDGLIVLKNRNAKNKSVKKFRNINSDMEQKFSSEIKNEVNIEKENEKEKQGKKNCILTLPPPTHNILSRANSMINKKLNQIFPKTFNNNNLKLNKNNKNQNFFKNGYNSGTVTNLNKYISYDKKKGNKSQQQLSKHTLYSNYYNGLSNLFKNFNYMTSKASKNINIINTKVPGILSVERTRSTNSMKNKSKRVIYSSLHFNGSNLQLLNLKNNIGTTKNAEKRYLSHGREFIEYKLVNNNDKIPLIKNRDNKTKPAKIGLKIKGKHLNFQKLLNPIPSKIQKGRSQDN